MRSVLGTCFTASLTFLAVLCKMSSLKFEGKILNDVDVVLLACDAVGTVELI